MDSIIDSWKKEFDIEYEHTLRILKKVPQDKLGFRPHPKSWSLGELATHISQVPSWGPSSLLEDSYTLGERADVPDDIQAIIERFKTHAETFVEAFKDATDEDLGKSWDLKTPDGTSILASTRFMIARRMVLNHLVHHRAQLGVYLRLLDIPVPGVYGPSADEQ